MKRFVVALTVALLSLPAYAGATYRFRSYTEASKNEMSGTVAVEGSKMKVTFEKGDQLFFKSGSVIISNDGGKTLNIVDAKKKTYTPINIQEIFSSVMSMAKSMAGMFEIAVSNQKVNVKSAGAGGTIQGFATQKFVVDSSYDMKMTVLGTKSDTRIENKTEAWTTDKISRDLISFVQMKGFKTGIPDVDKLMDMQSNSLKGFPLKQVTTSKQTSDGKTQTTKTTIEITEFKSVTVSPATFVIPPSFKKQELLQLGQ